VRSNDSQPSSLGSETTLLRCFLQPFRGFAFSERDACVLRGGPAVRIRVPPPPPASTREPRRADRIMVLSPAVVGCFRLCVLREIVRRRCGGRRITRPGPFLPVIRALQLQRFRVRASASCGTSSAGLSSRRPLIDDLTQQVVSGPCQSFDFSIKPRASPKPRLQNSGNPTAGARRRHFSVISGRCSVAGRRPAAFAPHCRCRCRAAGIDAAWPSDRK